MCVVCTLLYQRCVVVSDNDRRKTKRRFDEGAGGRFFGFFTGAGEEVVQRIDFCWASRTDFLFQGLCWDLQGGQPMEKLETISRDKYKKISIRLIRNFQLF